MSRSIKQLTITSDQEKFIRDNFKTMRRKDIVIQLGISKGKMDANLNIMKGLEFKARRPKAVKSDVSNDGLFNVNEYSDWLLGIKYEWL